MKSKHESAFPIPFLVQNIPITPGTCNPSDIEQALEFGLDVVKFFPAEAAGGLAMIKAMSAPYTKMKFMPTGGINASNLCSHLDFPKILACGGSWMVSSALVSAGEFDKIRDLTREAVNSMLGFELVHVGVNSADDADAEATAARFDEVFGFQKVAITLRESISANDNNWSAMLYTVVAVLIISSVFAPSGRTRPLFPLNDCG